VPQDAFAMRVEQLWTGNDFRNFHYLIACPQTGEALVIDPLDHALCLSRARALGLRITQIVNTHEHPDHTGGNEPLREATGAKLLAHEKAGAAIPGIDRGLAAGDVIRVGTGVELRVLDTPGHTMTHVCLYAEFAERDAQGVASALFCGDTLFNAGAGNCHNGGNPHVLYRSFAEQLVKLPDLTRVYPGHDYIARNLGFTLDREPDNQAAQALLPQVTDQDMAQPLVTTLGQEKSINVFLRLGSPTLRARLQSAFPELGRDPSDEAIFVKLRELRNRW
jgi:hydroxyacylglutathione hydrolase